MTGAPLGDVCREFGVPENTALDWRRHAVESSGLVRDPGDIRTQRRELDLEQLVGDLVSSSIRALVAQAGFAAERDWVQSQDARGLSEYRGVEIDRLIRLLRAFQREPVREVPERRAIDGDVVDAPAWPPDDGV